MAFAFTHDTFSVPRIMEQHLREATDEEKKRLNEEKNRQRLRHMKGGAENADFLLRRLKQSLQTLVDFRKKWALPDSDFIDKTTIFRTKAGHQLYSECLDFWDL